MGKLSMEMIQMHDQAISAVTKIQTSPLRCREVSKIKVNPYCSTHEQIVETRSS